MEAYRSSAHHGQADNNPDPIPQAPAVRRPGVLERIAGLVQGKKRELSPAEKERLEQYETSQELRQFGKVEIYSRS